MSLGTKPIRIGEVVNFAADWTDWLDTDRDASADDTLATATWSVVGGGSGLTVGATSLDAANLVATAAFTCASTVTVGTLYTVRCEVTTNTGSETFRREGTIKVVDG